MEEEKEKEKELWERYMTCMGYILTQYFVRLRIAIYHEDNDAEALSQTIFFNGKMNLLLLKPSYNILPCVVENSAQTGDNFMSG